MVVYSSDGKTYSSHEEARAAAGISSGTKKSSSSTTQSSQPKQSGNSVTQTSAPTSSNSTTTKSSSSSSQPITNITVQPVYVSGGSGGNTYRIVDENGNSHQISSSGQSLSDTAKYYSDKAAAAEAKGDTKSAQKYAQSAAEFQAAANYEKSSGITNTYGTSTGITYDATASLKLVDQGKNGKIGTAVLGDTALEYQAGHGLTDATQTATLGAKSMPSVAYSTDVTLANGEKLEVSGTNQISNNDVIWYGPYAGNNQTSAANTTISENPLDDVYKWDSSKGFFDNLAAAGSSFNEQSQAQMEDHYQSVKTNGAYNTFMAETGSAVDNYITWSDNLITSDDPAAKALGIANAVIMPTELTRTLKMVADGKVSETTPEDWGWAALDALALIPGIGAIGMAAKGGKLGKLGKLGKAGEGLKAVDTVEDASKLGKAADGTKATKTTGTADDLADASKIGKSGEIDKAVKAGGVAEDAAKAGKTTSKLQKVTKAAGTGSLLLQGGLLGSAVISGVLEGLNENGEPLPSDDGTRDTDIVTNDGLPYWMWSDEKKQEVYGPTVPNHEGQHITPTEAEESGLTDILSQALAGLHSGTNSSGVGGGGDITIVNEVPEKSDSGTDWAEVLEQVKPYIIPALCVIGAIVLLSIMSKDNKKGVKHGSHS